MIREAEKADCPSAASLAARMWTDHTKEELAKEFEALLDDPEAALLLCVEGDETVGFAHCCLRHDYVEGAESSPVGYLEGICVREDHRGRGHARALTEACEAWAKAKGCREFASDCEMDNESSRAFHLSCGFEEANRIICFIRKL